MIDEDTQFSIATRRAYLYSTYNNHGTSEEIDNALIAVSTYCTYMFRFPTDLVHPQGRITFIFVQWALLIFVSAAECEIASSY